MKKLYEKNELTFSIIWIVAYVVLFSVADGFSEDLGIQKIITAPLCVLMTLVLFIWIKKNGLSEKYGLCSFKGSWKNYLFFIPLLIIMSVNLWNGITFNPPVEYVNEAGETAVRTLSAVECALRVLSMLGVGFLEEVIFRGLLFKAICKRNVKQAIIISSVTFGIGHIVNLLRGADLVATLLQLCYAVALGFLFVIIFYKGKSLLPCIITHSVINSLSTFAVQPTKTFEIIIAAALCVVSVAYTLWILKTEKNNEESANEETIR